MAFNHITFAFAKAFLGKTIIMAAAANIVINNEAAAATTFEPYQVEGNTVVYVNRAPGAMQAWEILRITRKLPADRAKGVTRIRVELEVPQIDPVTGAVVRVNRKIDEYFEPAGATAVQNERVHAYSKNFLATTVALDAAKYGIIPT
jgi:hypothetical protein